MSRHSGCSNSLPALGVGITYSSSIEPLLESRPALVDVVEVEPQTVWLKTSNPAQPYRVLDKVLEHLNALPGRKLVHSVGTPVGGTVRPDSNQFAPLRRTIEHLRAHWASDHLSFNQTPEFSTGFFLPPRQTLDGIATVITAIRDLQNAISVPIAVETGVNYLRPRNDELPDGLFVAQVVDQADCGLLLDLHNVFANGLNGRQPVDEYLAQLPLHRVWEMHLAGGMELDGFWLDAHSGAIPDQLFEVAKQVVPALPNLKAIIFEIFPSFVSVVGLDVIRAQLERLHELWALRRPGTHSGFAERNVLQLAPIKTSDPATPAVWERALGKLVTGQPPDDEFGRELQSDPGVALVQGLIKEFRASMVVGVLRLTSRLLMLALGPSVFRGLLSDFWTKAPPQQFSSQEADNFAEYLTKLDLKVPQLSKTLEFERAATATLIDGLPRVISFDADPLPLLRALAEGRLPDAPLQPGHFEIEVTADGPISATGLDLRDVQQAFPFH